MKKLLCIFFAIFVFCFSVGCSTDKKNEVVLAKAAGNKLTYADIPASFDTTSIKSREKVNDFINHWINVSVLYEEAKDAGITNLDEYKNMVEQAKKDIAVNLLMKEEIYDKKININSNEILNYYNRYKNEYFLNSDIVNISYVLFVSENAATNFLQEISDKNKWLKEIETFIKAHAQELVTGYEDSIFFKRNELYPPDVWRSITSMAISEVSRPIKTLDGYMVAKLNSYQKEGEIGNLPYAKDDIIERLTVEKKKELYLKYLKSLHTKYRTENYFELSTNE